MQRCRCHNKPLTETTMQRYTCVSEPLTETTMKRCRCHNEPLTEMITEPAPPMIMMNQLPMDVWEDAMSQHLDVRTLAMLLLVDRSPMWRCMFDRRQQQLRGRCCMHHLMSPQAQQLPIETDDLFECACGNKVCDNCCEDDVGDYCDKCSDYLCDDCWDPWDPCGFCDETICKDCRGKCDHCEATMCLECGFYCEGCETTTCEMCHCECGSDDGGVDDD